MTHLQSIKRTLKAKGTALYDEFVQERLITCKVPLTKPITKNNIVLPESKSKDSIQYLRGRNLCLPRGKHLQGVNTSQCP